MRVWFKHLLTADRLGNMATSEAASRPMQLGHNFSKRKWAQVMWGKGPSKHMGFYTTLETPTKTPRQIEPLLQFADNADKKQAVRHAIARVKRHFEFDDSFKVQMFDWSEFECDHTVHSLAKSTRLIATMSYGFKIGVTTCPLWRHVTCDGEGPNGSMTSHYPTFNRIFILACDFGAAVGFLEKTLIAHTRACKQSQGKLLNVNPGNDGTIRERMLTFLYVVAKVPGV